MQHIVTGQAFFRWTAISYAYSKKPHDYYLCRCECGTERTVQANSLISGKSKSCGCWRRENSRNLHTKHGACAHPAYQSWSAMRRRCQDPTFVSYPYYGARGIRVCEKWQEFSGFWEDMGALWRHGMTIEREDVNGHYEPGNCTWITQAEQASNKRSSVIVETPWGPMTQTAAARKAGISLGSLIHRMKCGWPKELWFSPASRKGRKECPASI